MLLSIKYLICLGVFTAWLTPAQAEKVYRSVDETGAVEFSDQGAHDAEELELKSVPTYNFKKPKPTPAPSRAKPVDHLAVPIQIVSPEADATIRNNQGEVTVVLRLGESLSDTDKSRLAPKADGNKAIQGKPSQVEQEQKRAEQLKAGENIVILLDGKIIMETDKLSVLLKNIDRGSHELSAAIVDAQGKQLAVSPVVTFHMKRFSKLFKKPVNPVNPALPANPAK